MKGSLPKAAATSLHTDECPKVWVKGESRIWRSHAQIQNTAQSRGMTLSLGLVGEEVNSYRSWAWTHWVLRQEVGRGSSVV